MTCLSWACAWAIKHWALCMAAESFAPLSLCTGDCHLSSMMATPCLRTSPLALNTWCAYVGSS